MAGFWLLAALTLATLSSAMVRQLSYFKLGGTLVLTPSFSEKITSIVYMLNGNLVVVWAGDGSDLTYYGNFIGRTTLNPETGELVINNMGKDDIGKLLVEINNSLQYILYVFVEIKDVPEPEVTLRPLTCDLTSSSCSLLCDGDIKRSGPVTFYWRKGDGEWKESKQVMGITNDEETEKIQTFSCRMKNPVSDKESEAVKNPFFG